ncbi:hypothetical protein J3Q64DRAFT_1497475 [Phycomyces blakesleeanus]|uniref:Secreted protein n=1 Tax=Phycomyces blakesleeanus TaxID=4837 RepID=A0ABR3B044_PHYBL
MFSSTAIVANTLTTLLGLRAVANGMTCLSASEANLKKNQNNVCSSYRDSVFCKLLTVPFSFLRSLRFLRLSFSLVFFSTRPSNIYRHVRILDLFISFYLFFKKKFYLVYMAFSSLLCLDIRNHHLQ